MSFHHRHVALTKAASLAALAAAALPASVLAFATDGVNAIDLQPGYGISVKLIGIHPAPYAWATTKADIEIEPVAIAPEPVVQPEQTPEAKDEGEVDESGSGSGTSATGDAPQPVVQTGEAVAEPAASGTTVTA